MTEIQISEMARQIVRAEILLNWEFYLVQFGLLLFIGAVGFFGGEYLKTRGKAYATKADFSELKKQLADTTKLTEQIKQTVSDEAWRIKEYKTLKRIKLEELIRAADAAVQYLLHMYPIASGDEEQLIERDAVAEFCVIHTLYFQNLTKAHPFVHAFHVCHMSLVKFKGSTSTFKLWKKHFDKRWGSATLEEKQSLLLEHDERHKVNKDQHTERTTEWLDAYQTLLVSRNELQIEAAELMEQIIR